MSFFDTHAHLACDILWPQKDEILKRSIDSGVDKILTICTDFVELERGMSLRTMNPSSYFLAAATGPNEIEAQEEAFFPYVQKAAREGLLQAVGETGLDFHWNTSSEEAQTKALIRYLELSLECSLPIILHCRKAFKSLLKVLDAHYVGKKNCKGGIFHCFSEGPEEVLEVVKRGFFASFSGVVTYKSALCIQEAAKICPSEFILIETDSPYLTPGKDRQKTNEPAYIRLTAQKIADLRGVSLEEICDLTCRNACRLFDLKTL